MPVSPLSADDKKRLISADQMVLEGGENSAAADCHASQ
jgi:hypothetical protein